MENTPVKTLEPTLKDIINFVNCIVMRASSDMVGGADRIGTV